MNKPIFIASKKSEDEKPIRITLKGCLFTITVIIATVIGGFIGLITASFIMAHNIYPRWHKIEIPTGTLEIERILSLGNDDLFLNGTNYSNDQLFIITKNGEPFLFANNEWQSILPLPANTEIEMITRDYQDHLVASSTNGDHFILKDNQWITYGKEVIVNQLYYSNKACASTWKSLPTIKQPVSNSKGITNPGHSHNFDRYSRCYILFEDGNLEMWIYSNPGATQLFILGLGGVVGATVAGIIMILAVRFFYRRKNPQTINFN